MKPAEHKEALKDAFDAAKSMCGALHPDDMESAREELRELLDYTLKRLKKLHELERGLKLLGLDIKN